MPAPPHPKVVIAPAGLRRRCKELVAQHGIVETARILDVSKESLKNILAELAVRNGTVALIEKKLAERG